MESEVRMVQLTASRFFGGPERQMIGLAQGLSPEFRTVFVSFREEGLCDGLLDEACRAGFQGISLEHDTPHLLAARKELTDLLRRLGAHVLCCQGYKANLLGLLAARQLGIPVISISRGWTGESFRVRLYEALDRLVLRWMDKVVCVSAAQAQRVRGAGVRDDRIAVIHNAVRCERFARPDPAYRDLLCGMFPEMPSLIVGAAGRLSPEKGFNVLVDAAAQVLRSPLASGRGAGGDSPLAFGRGAGGEGHRIGFVLFGEGPQRDALTQQIKARGMEGRFLLGGFHTDLDRYLPHLDLFVQSSFTEGLPNVILEAQACGVPVVATSVGGTPEVVEDGKSGWLVPPGDAGLLTERISSLLDDDPTRAAFGRQGRIAVEDRFSFASQSQKYENLIAGLPGSFPRARAAMRTERPAVIR